MFGFLKFLFLDSRARKALQPPAASKPIPARRLRPAAAPPVRERDAATAIAEAEARMLKMPPEKAQLIRTARLIHRAQQSTLAELDDAQRQRLTEVAAQAFGLPKEPQR
ncbi:MAG: hypothetical protein HY985_07245 [Magnetospirillum sp.]|nr:hypothetical protein [Magnetospirillum sp.]